jgi:hypothetical protein
MRRSLASCLLLVFALAGSVAAQQLPSTAASPGATLPEIAALTPDEDGQLTLWLAAMEKWQKYDEKWRNRPVRDGWARIVDRQPPPAAPEWLPPHCGSIAAARLVGFDARIEQACRLVEDPRASPDPSVAAALNYSETPKHSSFLTRVHLDGMWTTTSSGSRFYGIVGSHVSLVDVGRLQVFGPPGVMLLTVPDQNGSRRVTLGYTWGFSLRLADVRIGAPTKNLTLFLNVTKVFLATGGNTRGFDIVGFSIAPRKKR